MPSVKFLNLNFIPRRDGLVINQLSYVRLFLSSRGPRQETLENDFYARLTIFLNHTFLPKNFHFHLYWNRVPNPVDDGRPTCPPNSEFDCLWAENLIDLISPSFINASNWIKPSLIKSLHFQKSLKTENKN